ncbi:hypothetical protein BDV96DRAFT_593005 [Lophiotrema nucula]|uniref:Myb-like domain-containing protein n=1 Tax=Lophiotrema nucula TaxID=690887 RepID=A0A6A5ZVS9_9PLEO|nr:hypothetical protein BDV96DRAFT_593005 [Lophiotrema nucula]
MDTSDHSRMTMDTPENIKPSAGASSLYIRQTEGSLKKQLSEGFTAEASSLAGSKEDMWLYWDAGMQHLQTINEQLEALRKRNAAQLPVDANAHKGEQMSDLQAAQILLDIAGPTLGSNADETAVPEASSLPVQTQTKRTGRWKDKSHWPRWQAEENKILIETAKRGIAWDDVMPKLPGRTRHAAQIHFAKLQKRGEAPAPMDCPKRALSRRKQPSFGS